MTDQETSRAGDIAIIGMACRFPGAHTLEDFWRNLCEGVESVVWFSEEALVAEGVDSSRLADTRYVRANAKLEGVDQFDAAFFGFTPNEARVMDPQQRLFLECTWEALEVAGYLSDSYDGQIAVFAGGADSDYLLQNLMPNRELLSRLGGVQVSLLNQSTFLSNHVSYRLDLRGLSTVVRNACATSLVATHLACQSLLGGECDVALAGGVKIDAQQTRGYFYEEGGILSPDGHCRAFDARAKGTTNGSGVGVVVLKRLSEALADRDHIWAVIRGSAVANDGGARASFTSPSVDGQIAVISECLAIAGVEPESLGYVEAHGSGTALGDPIEFEALTEVFRETTDRKKFCPIGSVKTNLGHLDEAAGVAGLIKTVLAVAHGKVPPSLNFEHPNPEIDFENSACFVNTRLRPWDRQSSPRRAGVSSFALGGTSAHIVVEEAPPVQPSESTASCQLITLSAKTASALEAASRNLAAYLREKPDLNLADAAFTLHVGRRSFQHRRSVVCESAKEAVGQLIEGQTAVSDLAARDETAVAFMFPGLGEHRVNMARDLYEAEPILRREIDRSAGLLEPHLGLDLRRALFSGRWGERSRGVSPGPEMNLRALRQRVQAGNPSSAEASSSDGLGELRHTSLAQPAVFVVEYALARLLVAWGIQPRVMIGYSIGELVAACLAGVMSLPDALELVAARARLIEELPPGAMLAVPVPENEISGILQGDLALAAIDGPNLSVVAGGRQEIDALRRELADKGTVSLPLATSHAFHSPHMEPVMAPFESLVARIALKPPEIPFVSNVSGDWIRDGEATDPRYWARQLRSTVRFWPGLGELLRSGARILVEVGPGRTLGVVARQHSAFSGDHRALSTLLRQESGSSHRQLLLAVGGLWTAGVSVDWESFHGHREGRRIPLPSYPFERRRFWVAPPGNFSEEAPAASGVDSEGAFGGALETEGSELTARSAASFELESSYVAPRNTTEETLVEIWQELFGVAKVGVRDNFFELGGHSLLSLQVVNRMRERFQLELSITVLFEAPTIEELGERIHEAADQIADSEVPAAAAEHVGRDEMQGESADLGLSTEDLGQLLQEVQSLSPEQVRQRLAEESAEGVKSENEELEV